ncbi:glycerophosphoryl diester phosphodiesterase membrane domain-containing protein [Salinibacterium sp. PAMC 21357]|uniref:glycerophosphoryl diester phosphodiesterase membrane domain-containing protein n=1 Tax=Salinibacterium sp. PAMC 21357 TaxID=1112215 RepID=UPI00192B1B4D|nr:glycerophosphoryl diester phosphodiesterase membrane domain-containing protein [Salinibacterium sp. PAMC 21357]
MSNSNPWQSPDSSGNSGESGPYAPPVLPQIPAQYGTPAPSWTPPPKPGLIPLRPMTLGTILSASLMVLRRNPRPIFGLSLIIMGVVTVASLILVGIVTFLGVDRTFSATGVDADIIEAGATVGVILAALFAVSLSLVGGSILQGIVSIEVARGAVGEKLRLSGLWAAAKGRLWALIGWSALVAVATFFGIVVFALVAALFFAIGGTAGTVFGVLSVLAGIVIGIALMAWLGTSLALVPSALMIERLPLGRAIRRSWSLVSGSFWRTFGILALIIVIVQVVSSVVTAPLSILGSFGAVLLNPTGNEAAGTATFVGLYIVTMILSVAIGAITIIIQSAAPALLYIDLRMRKEGFDLDLSRFVEARSTGDDSVPDPYVTVDSKAARASEPAPYAAS